MFGRQYLSEICPADDRAGPACQAHGGAGDAVTA